MLNIRGRGICKYPTNYQKLWKWLRFKKQKFQQCAWITKTNQQQYKKVWAFSNINHLTKRQNISPANEPRDLTSTWGWDGDKCWWVQKYKSKVLYTIDAFILTCIPWDVIMKQSIMFLHFWKPYPTMDFIPPLGYTPPLPPTVAQLISPPTRCLSMTFEKVIIVRLFINFHKIVHKVVQSFINNNAVNKIKCM